MDKNNYVAPAPGGGFETVVGGKVVATGVSQSSAEQAFNNAQGGQQTPPAGQSAPTGTTPAGTASQAGDGVFPNGDGTFRIVVGGKTDPYSYPSADVANGIYSNVTGSKGTGTNKTLIGGQNNVAYAPTDTLNSSNGPITIAKMGADLKALGWAGDVTNGMAVAQAYADTTKNPVADANGNTYVPNGAGPGNAGGVPASGSGGPGTIGGGYVPPEILAQITASAQAAATQAYLNRKLELVDIPLSQVEKDRIALQAATTASQNVIAENAQALQAAMSAGQLGQAANTTTVGAAESLGQLGQQANQTAAQAAANLAQFGTAANQTAAGAAEALGQFGTAANQTAAQAAQALAQTNLGQNQLAAQAANDLATQQQQQNQQALQAATEAGTLGLGVGNLLAQLRGPRNAFQEQAVANGLDAQGLSNVIGAINGTLRLPSFQAPQARPQAATLQTLEQDQMAAGGTPAGAPTAGPGTGVLAGQTLMDRLLGTAAGQAPVRVDTGNLARYGAGDFNFRTPQALYNYANGALPNRAPTQLTDYASGNLPNRAPAQLGQYASGQLPNKLPDQLVGYANGVLPNAIPDDLKKMMAGTMPQTVPTVTTPAYSATGPPSYDPATGAITLPKMATGGVTTGPAIAGEAGQPERIDPLVTASGQPAVAVTPITGVADTVRPIIAGQTGVDWSKAPGFSPGGTPNDPALWGRSSPTGPGGVPQGMTPASLPAATLAPYSGPSPFADKTGSYWTGTPGVYTAPPAQTPASYAPNVAGVTPVDRGGAAMTDLVPGENRAPIGPTGTMLGAGPAFRAPPAPPVFGGVNGSGLPYRTMQPDTSSPIGAALAAQGPPALASPAPAPGVMPPGGNITNGPRFPPNAAQNIYDTSMADYRSTIAAGRPWDQAALTASYAELGVPADVAAQVWQQTKGGTTNVPQNAAQLGAMLNSAPTPWGNGTGMAVNPGGPMQPAQPGGTPPPGMRPNPYGSGWLPATGVTNAGGPPANLQPWQNQPGAPGTFTEYNAGQVTAAGAPAAATAAYNTQRETAATPPSSTFTTPAPNTGGYAPLDPTQAKGLYDYTLAQYKQMQANGQPFTPQAFGGILADFGLPAAVAQRAWDLDQAYQTAHGGYSGDATTFQSVVNQAMGEAGYFNGPGATAGPGGRTGVPVSGLPSGQPTGPYTAPQPAATGTVIPPRSAISDAQWASLSPSTQTWLNNYYAANSAGMMGTPPAATTTSTLPADTSAVGTQGTPALTDAYKQALVPPNQIDIRAWGQMNPVDQQFALSAYEAQGYDPNRVLGMIAAEAPAFKAPTFGLAQ